MTGSLTNCAFCCNSTSSSTISAMAGDQMKVSSLIDASGVTKRGDAISAKTSSTYASHHAEVHSLLNNRHMNKNKRAVSPAPESGAYPDVTRRSKSMSRPERLASSSLTRQRSKSRSSRKLGSKSKSQRRSHSQPHKVKSSSDSKRKLKLTKQESGLDDVQEDERPLLEKSTSERSLPPTGKHVPVRSQSERGRKDDKVSRGREMDRMQSESAELFLNKPPRTKSLNKFLLRGRSASVRRKPQKPQSLIRSLSPSNKLLQPQEDDYNGIPYDTFIREGSMESFQSSLTSNDHEIQNKPRSSSLIRSAIKHLGGISSKMKHGPEVETDDTQVSHSTMDTSGADSGSFSPTVPTKWDPSASILNQGGGQLEIIDSESDEDASCATRSDHGDDNKAGLEEDDTLKYDQVFHSSGHPMFQNTMDCDEEGDGSGKKVWATIGKAIGRGRSLSVSRRKHKVDHVEAFAKFNEDEPDFDTPLQAQHVQPMSRQFQKKTIKQPPKSKLRSASVDTRNRLKPSGKRSARSISATRTTTTKKVVVSSSDSQKSDFKPRKKRVKCIICKQRLSKGQCVEHMEFYFCAGSEEQDSCFQCAKCKCGLEQLLPGDVRVCNAQVMTNSRGSVVHCGECSKPLTETPEEKEPAGQSPEVKEDPPVEETPAFKFCASCNGGFENYNGEIQVLGEHTYHSACLRHESLKASGQSTGSRFSASNSFGDEDTPADAAQKLADKSVVKLSIQNDRKGEREYLSATFFEWPKKQECLAKMKEKERNKRMEQFLRNDDSAIDLSLEVAYELDAQAFGNPNYSGHFSSNQLTGDHKYSPRKTFVAFPVDVHVEEDGRISTDLIAELQWIGRPNPVTLKHVSSTLTIEPFPYEDSDSIRKVLNQVWKYEFNGIYHEFQFSVPFKSSSDESLSLTISEGDELDLIDCFFDAFIDVNQKPKVKLPDQDPMKFKNRQTESTLDTSTKSTPSSDGLDWESRADQLMHEVDNLRDFDPSRVMSKSVPPGRRSRNSRRSSSDSISLQNIREHSLDPDGDEITNMSELLSVARSGEHHPVSLPKIMHIKARKDSLNDDTGLSLIESNGSSIVAEVSKSGLFTSELKEGSVVLAINGRPVRNPRHFMRLFKDAESKVTVMASDEPPIPGSFFSVVRKEKDSLPDMDSLKSSPQDTVDTLGISFEMVRGLVRVREIAPDGIFANTRIAVGDICLMVDGVPAANSLSSAVRALAFARGAISLLTFSLHNVWSNLMDLMISEEYTRNWNGLACQLTDHNGCHMNIYFDSVSGRCFEDAPGAESIKSDLSNMNKIIDRVMEMLVQSIKVHKEPSDPRGSFGSPSRTHGLSVSASGCLKGRSDVYRRALIKLEEMKATGKLSKKDYNDAKHALAAVAITSDK